MSRNNALLIGTLLGCLAGAVATSLIGFLDKSGNIRLIVDPAALLLVAAPYGLIAAIAIWSRHRVVGLAICLLTTAVIAPWAGIILWNDHLALQREPPGQGTMHMALLVALLIEWVGCGIAVAGVAGYRLIAARRPKPA
jgi:hypothetical protein